MRKPRMGNTSKQVFKLALPISGSRLLSTITSFLTIALLARYNSTSLAASALISTTQLVILLAGMAILFSTSILVGHEYGAKQFFKIANITHQAILLSLYISAVLMVIFWFVGPILLFCHQPEYLVTEVHKYFIVFSFGVPAVLIFSALQQVLFTIKKQNIALMIDVISLVLTLSLSIGCIYGKFGFPELGVVGLAYAIVMQAWIILIGTCAYFMFSPSCKPYAFFKNFKFENSTVLQLFHTGWPISVSITGEILSLFVTTVMAGWLGIIALDAQQITTQYLLLLVVPIFGISQAISILSSHLMGAKQDVLLKKHGEAAIQLGILFAFIALIVFILCPTTLISAFVDTNDTHNFELVKLTTLLLPLICVGQFFDGLRNICTGSLRGMKNVIKPMLISMGYIWLFSIPVAYIFGFQFHWGLVGIIIAYNLGMVFAGFQLYWVWLKTVNPLVDSAKALPMQHSEFQKLSET